MKEGSVYETAQILGVGDGLLLPDDDVYRIQTEITKLGAQLMMAALFPAFLDSKEESRYHSVSKR